MAAVLTWPVVSIVPGAGLDPAYGYALGQAVRQGIPFGPGLAFTYGPLGFLTAPTLWSASTAAGALAVVGVIHLAWCAVVWVAARRHLPRLAAVVVLVLTMWLSTMSPASETGDAAELLGLALALAGLLLIERPPPPRWVGAALAAGSVAVAFALLAKFDTGLVAAGVVICTGAALGDRWWAGAAACAGGVLLAVVVLWLAAGQALGDLPGFARESVAMSLGWGDALRYEAPGTGWQYPVAAVLAVAVVGLMAAGGLRRRPAAWLIVLGVLAVGFKHGFVRHDAHATEYFLTAVVLLLAATPAPGGRHALWMGSVALAAAVLFVVSAPVRPAAVSFARSAGRLGRQAAELISASHRHAVEQTGRSAIRSAYPLPPPALALLRGHGVQIEPWQTSIAWAYGLHWQPTPVFQTNMIDEHSLDTLMASSLTRPSAPAAILRARGSDLGVPEAWDGPAYRLAELCNYREAFSGPSWEVLVRAAPRCGRPLPLGTVPLLPGRPVPVPAAPAGDVVTASIQLPGPGLGTRLVDLLYKPTTGLELSAGDVSGLVYRATVSGPLVVSVPGGVQPGGDWPSAPTLSLTGFSGQAHVTFSAVPLAR